MSKKFWTTEPPTKPNGETELWLILKGNALNKSNIWLGPKDRMYWKGEQGFKGYIKYIIEAYSIKYWSREPIRFPDPPGEGEI